MDNKIALKQQLYEVCKKQIEERVQVIVDRLTAIRAAKNNETKSSAGDKYETGRAMMQIEEENSKRQLFQAKKVQYQLSQIKLGEETDKVDLGSLVLTNKGNYYISIGIGKVQLETDLYFCISINAPIALKMKGKQAGETFVFNGKLIEIVDV